MAQLDVLRNIYCAFVSGDAGDATAANQVLEIAALDAINAKLPSLGQALMAASVPVVLASNQSSIPVTVAAGTAVIGHVIVDSGTITTVSTVTNLSQFGGFAINLGAGAVGTGTLRMTLASDDPAVAVLGTTSGAKVITDANGTIQQYLRGLVSQWIAGTLVVGTGTNSIGGTKDNGPQWTPTRQYTAIASATTTDITGAPTGGQKIYADDILISADAAQTVSIVEETSGTVFAKVFVPAYGTVQITPRDGLKAAVADKKMRAITATSANTSITCFYHSEA